MKNEGPDVFKSKGIDKAIGVLNFHFKSSKFSELSGVNRDKIINDILSKVSEISSPIIKQDFISKIAQATNLEENQIIHMLSKQATRYKSKQAEDEKDKPSKLFSTVNGKAELGIIQVLSGNNDEARKLLKEKLDVDKIENLQIKKLVEILLKSNKVNPAEIISHFEEQDEREIISEVLMLDDQTSEHLEMAKDCLTTLSKISVKEKIKQLRLQIREMETAGKDTSELMLKVVEMQKDLND